MRWNSGTQKEIAEKIVNSGANYTLALKGNDKHLNENARSIFQKDKPKRHHEEIEKEHGRLTSRVYDLISVDKYNLSQAPNWRGLQSIGRVQTETLKSGTQTTETQYYLLSYKDVKLFAKSARGHWGIES